MQKVSLGYDFDIPQLSARNHGSIPGKTKIYFFYLQNFETDYVGQPNPVGTEDSSRR